MIIEGAFIKHKGYIFYNTVNLRGSHQTTHLLHCLVISAQSVCCAIVVFTKGLMRDEDRGVDMWPGSQMRPTS